MIANDPAAIIVSEVASLCRRTSARASQLMESWGWGDGNLIDPSEPYTDPKTGEIWAPVHWAGGVNNTQAAVYRSPVEYRNVLRLGRWLAEENEWAQNVHENRISYVIGWGHQYQAKWKTDQEGSGEELAAVDEIIKKFLSVNRWSPVYMSAHYESEYKGRASWGFRQQQNLLRRDRDGSCLTRKFQNDDGILRLRYVEPETLQAPPGRENEIPYGIETDPDDRETVVAYWLNGAERVEADEIQHRARGASDVSPLGVPINYSVRKNLARAQKILKSGSTVTEIQTAIALIRKMGGAINSSLTSLVANKATGSHEENGSGQTVLHERFRSGTILTVPKDAEYEMPGMGIDPSKYIASLQGELRAIAARHCMPEFMISSDASNANFASTMVAEGPAVKMFERLQWDEICCDLELIWYALRFAAQSGLIASELLERIDIKAEAPVVQTRDKLKDAQCDQIYNTIKVKSATTIQLEQGLDAENEAENFRDEAQRAEELMPETLRVPGLDEENPEDDLDGGEDDPDPEDDGDDGFFAPEWYVEARGGGRRGAKKMRGGQRGKRIKPGSGNCGTGAGGFQSKNVCAAGDGSKSKSKKFSNKKARENPRFAEANERRAARRMANAKIRNAPVPSREAVVKARAELQRARDGQGRAGGDSRGGSAAARRRQRENLFHEFGGAERGYVVCPWTGRRMHWTSDRRQNPHGYELFERGKIFVKRQGGGYQLPNLIPESFEANRARNDRILRPENNR